MTRFYLPRTLTAPYVPPVSVIGDFDGTWDGGSTSALLLSQAKEGAAGATTYAVPTTTDYDYMCRRFASEPITEGGLLGGTVEWVQKWRPSDTGVTGRTHTHIYVLVGQTATVRGVLLADHVGAAAWNAVAYRGYTSGPIEVSPVEVSAGDTLVVEMGFRSSSNSASHTVQIFNGATGADAVAGSDSTSEVAWFDFNALDGLAVVPPVEPEETTARLFLTSTSSAVAGDPSAGAWDDTTINAARVMDFEPSGSPAELTRTETNATANWDVLLGSWVSPTITVAGSIAASSQVRIVLARRSSSGAGLLGRYRMYAVNSSGTVTGSAFNLASGSTGLFNETANPVGLAITASTTTELEVQPGDRLVFEFGTRQPAATGTASTSSIWAGGEDPTPQVAGGTDIDDPGYLDIEAAHLFVAPDVNSSQFLPFFR